MQTVPRPLGQIIPNSVFVKLRFQDYNLYAIDGVAAKQESFRLNSLYDPQYSLGGGQPTGLASWANFFYKYIVYGAKVEAYFSTLGAPGKQLCCGIVGQTAAQANNGIINLDPDNILESPRNIASSKMLPPIFPFSAVSVMECSITKVSKFFNIRKLEARPLDSNYEANCSGSPSFVPVATCGVATLDSGLMAGANYGIAMMVIITYYVKFFANKTQEDT